MQEQAEKLKSWKIKRWKSEGLVGMMGIMVVMIGGYDGVVKVEWLIMTTFSWTIQHWLQNFYYFNDNLLFIKCVVTIGLYCLDSLVHQFLVSIVNRKTRFGSTCNYVKHRMSILHLLHFGKTPLTRILKDRYSDYF